MAGISVMNPWSQVVIEIDPADIDQRRLDALADMMDDDVREELHSSPNGAHEWTSPGAFFAAYAERVGPAAAGSIWFT